MTEFVFYGTFGSGQPGFPGYLRVRVEAENYGDAFHNAHQRMREATDNRWCMLYDSEESLHPADRVYRGEA